MSSLQSSLLTGIVQANFVRTVFVHVIVALQYMQCMHLHCHEALHAVQSHGCTEVAAAV
jgi:hypothetical protein